MVMGKKYNQLKIDEREMIAVLRAEGKSAREIGRELGRSHSTIVRELKNNSAPVNKGYYLSHKAQERAEGRKRNAGVRVHLKSEHIRTYVESNVKRGWSPVQIAGRLSIDNPGLSISHEAIYQYIYIDAPDLIGYLARRHKKRHLKGQGRKHKKSHIPNRISIDERPKIVEERNELGHWESDSMVSRISNTALNVLVERLSRFVKITKLERKTAALTQEGINNRLFHYPKSARLSITYDNGSENVEHELVNKTLGTKSYFCNPYHSWEKGTVENTCGLIRRYIPKKTDISLIADSEIKRIENDLNNRPRKCLNFLTPAEFFGKLCGALPD